MNEELETCKVDLNMKENLEDIYNNPVVQMLLSVLNVCPGIKDGVDSAVAIALSSFQKKKITKLLELIFRDSKVTMDDVKDVTVIMEFAKMLDAVKRLSRNGKIKYLANLMRGSICDIRKGEVDEFEERLESLLLLSEREIHLLEILFQCEEKNMPVKNKLDYVKSWNDFLKQTKKIFSFNETDACSHIMAITKSGYCLVEWRSGLNNTGTMFAYTTPAYHRLRQIILEE